MFIAFVFVWFIYVFCFFFFSSRRRHTRYIGDWSSDVCSSVFCSPSRAAICAAMIGPTASPWAPGSEERRVGKEWGSRWGAGREKKKKKKERCAEDEKKKDRKECDGRMQRSDRGVRRHARD